MCAYYTHYRRACDKWLHTGQPASVHIVKISAFLFILLRPCDPKILHFLVGIFYSFNVTYIHSRTYLKSFIYAHKKKKRAYPFLSKLFQPTNNQKPKMKNENNYLILTGQITTLISLLPVTHTKGDFGDFA